MVDATQIKEHAEVIGSDGEHVGTVDHVEGSDRIKLTRRDPEARGEHHYIPLAWVDAVENEQVRLNKTAREAEAGWQGEGGEQNSESAAM
jgi:hypothetical protein